MLTSLSIASQTPIGDVLGQFGCQVYWITSVISSQALAIGGLGMAIFRLFCVEKGLTLMRYNCDRIVNLIHLAEVIVLTGTVSLNTYGVISDGWEQAAMYQFCMNHGHLEGEVLKSYNRSENQSFGKLHQFP